ncbi:MAG: DUF2786 domain-containing protein [Succinatimonas sp.]|nr:DUF2786 domain-containing protein [Succinatimonas sp.]
MSNKYIDQITKLLALSKSSNPHEAALALKRAHKLMQMYQLDFQDLNNRIFSELSLNFSRGINHKEIALLIAYIIKNLTPCYVLAKQTPKELIFIGDNSSLLQVKYIFTFLDRTLVNAKKAYVKALKKDKELNNPAFASLLKIYPLKLVKLLLKNNLARQNYVLKRQTDTYLIGFLQAICANLTPQEITLPTALLEFVNTKYPHLKKQISRKRTANKEEQLAFTQGFKDGEMIKLNKAIYGEEKNKYLIFK